MATTTAVPVTTNFLDPIKLLTFVASCGQEYEHQATIIFAGKDGSLMPNAVDTTSGNQLAFIRESIASSGFTKKKQILTISHATDKYVVVNVGKGPLSREKLRKLAGNLVDYLNDEKLVRVRVIIEDTSGSHTNDLYDLTFGMQMSAYVFNLKSKPEVKTLQTVCVMHKFTDVNVADITQEATHDAMGSQFMRKLVKLPANKLGTLELLGAAEEISRICPEVTVSYEVVDAESNKDLMYTVGKASNQPTIMITVRYAGDTNAPLKVMVGKGITFDTGGVNVKPDGGKGMEADMGGSALVLGAILTAALRGEPVNLVGILCAARNDIGPESYVVGDVLTAGNGTTVEITNTDAEGRLVMAEGLICAENIYAPDTILSFATLTGAAKIATGRRAPIFSHDANLVAAMETAAAAAGEMVLHFPMDEYLEETLESGIADTLNANVKTRLCGHTTAAIFLNKFVNETPYIHCDMGGAIEDGYFGIPMVMEYLTASAAT